MIACYTLEEVKALVGLPCEVSSYQVVTQEKIDAFAALTGDHQWIHVDRERAARESPYGTTIAHGMLTLSILPMLLAECFTFPTRRSGVFYGIEGLRFVSAVPADSHIRGRFKLESYKLAGENAITCTWNAVVEIRGKDKPAVAGHWIGRMTF